MQLRTTGTGGGTERPQYQILRRLGQLEQKENLVKMSTVGLFVGLLLGAVLVFEGFGAMLIVALFGAIGYVAAKVKEGEIDLNNYLGNRNGRR